MAESARYREGEQGVYAVGMRGKLPGASRRVRVLPDAVVPPLTAAESAGSPANPMIRAAAFGRFGAHAEPTGSAGDAAAGSESAAVSENAAAVETPDPYGFGWVAGILPSPAKGDRYLVEFLDRDTFRILAYADRFARVFSVDRPITAPPARVPDLAFVRYPDDVGDPGDSAEPADSVDHAGGPADAEEAGFVEVRTPDGETLHPAEYRLTQGRYSFAGSWHAFGDYANGLTLADAVARAYFAFVYRPARYGTPVFEHGLGPITRMLRTEDVAEALSDIVACVRSAEADGSLCAPPLVRCLARWLADAGVEALSAFSFGGSAGLRIARTVRYADLLYLAVEDGCPVPQRMIWAIEAALNRAMLVAERLGDRAAVATMAECCEADAQVTECIGDQAAHAVDPAPDVPAREWDVRVAIASAIERLRLPYRVETEFHLDVAAGVAAFSATVPDAQLMPSAAWSDEQGAWEDVADADRVGASMRYAMRAGVLLAAIAFSSARAIRRVSVCLTPLSGEGELGGPRALAEAWIRAGAPEGGPAAIGGDRAAAGKAEEATSCLVVFDRVRFCMDDAYRAAACGDPADFYRFFDAQLIDASDADPFSIVRSLPSNATRNGSPEVVSGSLPDEAAAALGATTLEGLRIYDKAERRRVAEGLAGRISRTTTATEGVAIVREVQASTGDPLVHEGCMRLMAALTEGSIDTGDQNEIVNAFLGDDRYFAALGRARKAFKSSWKEAVDILETAVAEADAEGRFSDSKEVVHRVFDTYASRVLYNLGREGALPWLGADAAGADADTDSSVELVPDTLYACCLEAASLLERVPDRARDALRFSRKCMQMAPTIAAGYRQAARACMIAGDPLEARSVLTDCLRIAVRPEDVSVAYYQIAYVEWNLGRFASAVAAYLKSLDVSSVVAPQAAIELRRLMSESDLSPLDPDAVDPTLLEAGIPVISQDDLVSVLDRAIAAAVDVGAFPVAHNLLSLRLRHRPDDALASVALSLT